MNNYIQTPDVVSFASMPAPRKDVPKPLPFGAYTRTILCSNCGNWLYAPAVPHESRPLITACKCWRRVNSMPKEKCPKELLQSASYPDWAPDCASCGKGGIPVLKEGIGYKRAGYCDYCGVFTILNKKESGETVVQGGLEALKEGQDAP